MERRLAAIDIGSHTARLLIARVSPKGKLEEIERARSYIHLARYISGNSPKLLNAKAVESVSRVLNEFKERIHFYGVEKSFALGTGLVREADNREEFIDKVFELSGILIHPISPEKEALLSAKGATLSGFIQLPALVFDLGGGSTEFCLLRARTHHSRSIPLGASVFTKRFIKADPPQLRELERLRKEILRLLNKGLSGFPNVDQDCVELVATGGTVVSIGAIHLKIPTEALSPQRINGITLERERVLELAKKLSGLPTTQRARIVGLDYGRAPVIVAGTWAVYHILEYLGFKRFTISMYDLLEGTLLELLEGEEDG